MTVLKRTTLHLHVFQLLFQLSHIYHGDNPQVLCSFTDFLPSLFSRLSPHFFVLRIHEAFINQALHMRHVFFCMLNPHLCQVTGSTKRFLTPATIILCIVKRSVCIDHLPILSDSESAFSGAPVHRKSACNHTSNAYRQRKAQTAAVFITIDFRQGLPVCRNHWAPAGMHFLSRKP